MYPAPATTQDAAKKLHRATEVCPVVYMLRGGGPHGNAIILDVSDTFLAGKTGYGRAGGGIYILDF